MTDKKHTAQWCQAAGSYMFVDEDELHRVLDANTDAFTIYVDQADKTEDGLYAVIGARYKSCGHDNPMVFNRQKQDLRKTLQTRTGREIKNEDLEMIGYWWEDVTRPRVNS